MDPSRVHEVTGLLLSWRQGDAAALDRLVPLVYDELRRVARGHLRRESPGHALQATAAMVAALSSASNQNTLDDLDFRVSQLEACVGDIQQTLDFPDPSGFGVVILPNCPAGF